MAVKAGSKAKKEEISPPFSDLELELDEPTSLDNDATGFKVADASKERICPPFPTKKIEVNKPYLWTEWVDQLEQVDLDHLQIYLYRQWPVIDRQKNNPKASLNIDKLPNKESCYINSIMVNHGSGLYKLLVNDINKAINGKGGTIGIANINIEDVNHPPILVLEELVTDHPSNRTYVDRLRAEGKLNSEGRIMTQQGGNDQTQLIALLSRMIEKQSIQPVQQKQDTSTEAISKMYLEANSAVVGMLKDQVKTDGPDKLLVMLSALKDMIPKPESNNEFMALLVKMQMDASSRADQANARLMEVLTKTPPDAESAVLEKMTMYKELFGGEGGKEHRRSVAEVIIDAAGPILLNVSEIIKNTLSMKNFAAGMGMNKSPQVNQPAQIVEAQPQAPIQGENVVEMPKQINELEMILTQYGGFVIESIKRGEPGSQFAEAVSTMAGPVVYKKISALGNEGLLNGMKSVIPFWNAAVTVASEDIMKEFVDDFIAFGTGEGEEE